MSNYYGKDTVIIHAGVRVHGRFARFPDGIVMLEYQSVVSKASV